MTTSEAAASAQEHGLDLHHLIDTHISNLKLAGDVNGALEQLDVAHALHEAIPEVSIAVIPASDTGAASGADDVTSAYSAVGSAAASGRATC